MKSPQRRADEGLWIIFSELTHYLPLIKTVCETAERAGIKGETVPACDRIFSLFEEHTELIKRGKSNKPVEFGHAVWLAWAVNLSPRPRLFLCALRDLLFS